MKYFKIEDDNYILCIYTAKTGANSIKKSEYDAILSAIRNVPQQNDNIEYRLTKALVWEATATEY